MSTETQSVRIFIAYAHEDNSSREKLRRQLSVLERRGHFAIFWDGLIKPGERWDKRLKDELHRADIFLLLVSDAFLDSEYVHEVELPKALALRNEGKAEVVPVILRDCLWERTELNDFQCVLFEGRPIEDANNGYAHVARLVADMAEQIGVKREAEARTEADSAAKIQQAKQASDKKRQQTLADEAARQLARDTALQAARDEADHDYWELADEADTEVAIKRYQKKYPDGLHAAEAETRLWAFEKKRTDAAVLAAEQERQHRAQREKVEANRRDLEEQNRLKRERESDLRVIDNLSTINSKNALLQIAGHSHPGMERDYQEDRYIICADLDAPVWSEAGRGPFCPGRRGTLLVVADGLGGDKRIHYDDDNYFYENGEVASRLAIEGVKDYFSKNQTAGNTPQYALMRCISHANDRIIQYATKHKDTEGMGTTLVIAWIIDNTVYVGWSGNSRCYLVREGNIRQINYDHSHVQELIAAGRISAEEAFYHPDKNIITQHLGDVGRAPDPSTAQATLLPGDRLLLCSNGLNTMLHDPEIAQLLASGDPERCAHDLVDAANAAGGHENITVVVTEVLNLKNAQAPVAYAPIHGVDTRVPAQAEPITNFTKRQKAWWERL